MPAPLTLATTRECHSNEDEPIITAEDMATVPAEDVPTVPAQNVSTVPAENVSTISSEDMPTHSELSGAYDHDTGSLETGSSESDSSTEENSSDTGNDQADACGEDDTHVTASASEFSDRLGQAIEPGIDVINENIVEVQEKPQISASVLPVLVIKSSEHDMDMDVEEIPPPHGSSSATAGFLHGQAYGNVLNHADLSKVSHWWYFFYEKYPSGLYSFRLLGL